MPPSDEHPRPSGPQAWFQDSLREFAPYVGLGIQLAAAILAFFCVGWWVDGRWATGPWGRLVGIMLGAVGGMIKFVRTVTAPGFGSESKDRHGT